MKKTITILLIAALLVAGYFLLTNANLVQANNSDLETLATYEVQLGTLSATVSATGTVRSNQSAVITWQASGMIDEVNVTLGDTVKSGQLLADLVQTSLPQSVITAQNDLVNAQNELDDLVDEYNSLSLAEAQKAIADAQDALEEAERTLLNYQTPAPQTDIDQAYADMLLAEDELEKARDDYEPYAEKPEDDLTRANYLSRLATAQEQYDDMVRTYNYLTGTATATDLAIAEADVEVAKEELADAQAEYERLLSGVDSDDVAAAKAKIAAAEATLNNAWVEAPFDGVITKVYSQSGDLVSSGEQAFQQDDLSRLLVDLEVSEVDITQIEVGQSVQMTFDAIRDKEYSGEVFEVALVGDDDGGVVNFDVVVALTDPDEDVRPGMTSAVEIIVNQLQEALLVPNQSLRVIAGNRVVYILNEVQPTSDEAQSASGIGRFLSSLRGGQPSSPATSMVEVTVGATSYSFSQILDGDLLVGDQVLLNPPTNLEADFGPGSNSPFGG